MFKNLVWGLVAVGALSLAACRKDALKQLSPEEARIYITNHDSTAVFSGFQTYSIADSVGVIEDNQGRGMQLTTYDATVISAFKEAMAARGFLLVDRTASPDLGVTVSRVYNNYTGLISYPSYWDYYGSFYDPYYWGYGGYGYYDPIYYGPGYYGYYQVTQGALSIDMLNLRDAKNDNTIRPVWSGMVRGEGTFGSSNVSKIVTQLFEQSPYLQTN